MTAPLLAITDLHLRLKSFEGEAHVLNGIDLTVNRNEIWGLVGETGCGKSVTGLSVSRLLPSPPARYTAGTIRFDGTDIMTLPESAMRALRGRRIGMIFQDPTTNLNPSFRIGEQLADVALAAARHSPDLLGLPASASGKEKRRAAQALALAMLEEVGIPNASARLNDYPHQFSGGMRQRVLIAMALIARPDLLIADEPTTALDVTVQGQVLALLKRMVTAHSMGVILITHNLAVVSQTCTHVAVMYAGNIVEKGETEAVLSRPAHPYTRALLAAIPRQGAKRGALMALGGSVPNLIAPPPGCRFAPRCEQAQEACRAGTPPLTPLAREHQVACLHPIIVEAPAHA